MSGRGGLRRRVTWAFIALGAVLSVLFAVATTFVAEDYEEVLVEEILRGQAEDYTLRLATHPDASLPRTHRLSGYRRGADDVPDHLLALAPGISEDEDGVHVGVFDTDQGRLYFVIDLSDIEKMERHLALFVVAVVILGTVLSGWLGWLLSGRATAPVRELAARVDALDAVPRRTDLAAGATLDELNRLAQAIDRYQARLVDADDAERAFFADASHELRTPVAVVRGAVELLLDDPGADAATQRRLQRLDRGVRELSDLIDALMSLVRGNPVSTSAIEARVLLTECAEALRGPLDAAQARITVDAEGVLIVPRREALLVLGGIARRLLPADAHGELTLRARGHLIEFITLGATEDEARDEPVGARRSDRNLGLTLIGKLAARLGWRIEEEPGARRARLLLGD